MLWLLHVLCVLQLAEHTSSVEECWLSVNVDVALWLDCQTYEKKPTLKRVSDFVLVNPVVHQEFNDFAKAEITPELQLLLDVDLIKVWETDKALSLPRCFDIKTCMSTSAALNLMTYACGYMI